MVNQKKSFLISQLLQSKITIFILIFITCSACSVNEYIRRKTAVSERVEKSLHFAGEVKIIGNRQIADSVFLCEAVTRRKDTLFILSKTPESSPTQETQSVELIRLVPRVKLWADGTYMTYSLHYLRSFSGRKLLKKSKAYIVYGNNMVDSCDCFFGKNPCQRYYISDDDSERFSFTYNNGLNFLIPSK